MEKVLTLTKEQFDRFKKAKAREKVAKELLGLPSNAKIGIGDTAVKISNSSSLDVYKDAWKGQERFYIVIEPMDETTAMAYSIYPKL